METIIPYRRKRAAQVGMFELLQFYVRHAPHYVWRQIVRFYVWYRRGRPSAQAMAPSTDECMEEGS